MTDYLYNCASHTTCQPIEVYLSKGRYKFELWGAQGGNTSYKEGGFGGYASGIISFEEKRKFYLFIGAAGFEGTKTGLTDPTYNGGGRGTYSNYQYTGCSGGGATDIRTGLGIDDRIIVAGGGGGAGNNPYNSASNPGGSGGGKHGCDGFDGKGPSAIQKGTGGTDTEGGSSCSTDRAGKKFYGGNQTQAGYYGSGGGGGYYGGGAGCAYGASGGGGSGYVSVLFSKRKLLPGNGSIINFYNYRLDAVGHRGNGAIRITPLQSFVTCKASKISLRFVLCSISFLIS